ncbi:MAG TPA: DUF4173 domain-containing protein [Symbiobacteriaceae bacterium]|nr:DUF4173 domain-containing protein [Symbiobacteriaceae bacterium]
MDGKTKAGLVILITAAALGLLGDVLLLPAPYGLNAFLWIAAVTGGLLVAARLGEVALAPGARWLVVPAVVFTGAAVWRGAEALIFLDFLALFASLILTIRAARGGNVQESGIIQHGLGVLLAGVETLAGPFFLLFSDVNWKELPQGRWSGQTAAVVRGLLIAIPLLLVFGALFVAADAVFASLTDRVVQFADGDIFAHILRTLIWGALVAGFLRAALLSKEPALPGGDRPASLSFGAIETGVVLGLLNALFLAFVAVQFRYFFGGAALVEATTGLTYAEYARRGFFELVGVSTLVLPLLLGLHWLLPAEGAGARRLFRYLAGALVAQLFIIMASAVQRMMLYQGEFGLTEQRLYATVFMGWLAVLFLWFITTVMRERRGRFVIGAVVSGFVLLAGLHLANPSALIARTNLARAAEGKRFDAAYAASLGADAVPVLIEALPGLAPADQSVIAQWLLVRNNTHRMDDWRNWNWSRAKATRLIESNREALNSWAGPQ